MARQYGPAVQTKIAIAQRLRPPLPLSTRFKMSELGAARSPKVAGKQGVIIGGGRYNSSVRVLFDGYKSPMSLHRDYIEPLPQPGRAVTAFRPA
jgi:hypothetical protein